MPPTDPNAIAAASFVVGLLAGVGLMAVRQATLAFSKEVRKLSSATEDRGDMPKNLSQGMPPMGEKPKEDRWYQ